jgi:hypothetical protein
LLRTPAIEQEPGHHERQRHDPTNHGGDRQCTRSSARPSHDTLDRGPGRPALVWRGKNFAERERLSEPRARRRRTRRHKHRTRRHERGSH